MSRAARIHRHVFVTLTLAWMALAWGGCAKGIGESTAGTSSASASSSSGTGGSGGAGGSDITSNVGGGSSGSGACVTTSAEAHRIPLDIVFLIDRSASMSGIKWNGTKAALTKFFNDPASVDIGAGLVYFPAQKSDQCTPTSYQVLDVPIDVLPMNAFALTNSMPFDALGSITPTYGALKGALMSATAYQDAHPTHKVIVVLATDGDPTGCEARTIDDIANLATSARKYNGVRTYVIGVAGSTIANLDKIAAAGGTMSAYDITQDIGAFSAKIAEIRTQALGCDFALPAPPNGQALDPDKVNFTYTPQSMGAPKILPRADDLADCKGQPGWYYGSSSGSTEILLCPASCATVQADSKAKVSVLFGCNSVVN
jgi:von Willebrand factor type A domain